MTVTTTPGTQFYTGDGALQDFDFGFKVYNTTDVQVYVNGVLLTLGVGYTVTLNVGTDGGTIHFTTPPPLVRDDNGDPSENIFFKRVLPFSQGTTLPVKGALPSVTLENMFDKLTILCQQLKEVTDRAVQRALADLSTAALYLPLPSDGKGLIWRNGILANSDQVIGDVANDAAESATAAAASALDAAASAEAALGAASAVGGLSVKGQLISYDGTDPYLLNPGADGYFLASTSGSDSGLSWLPSPTNATDDLYEMLLGYVGTTPPKYASSTTLTVSKVYQRDITGTRGTIKSGSSLTCDIATTGPGGIAISANLTGTLTITANSNAVTFSTSQAGVLQVGDVVTTAGGQARRLITMGTTSGTVESNWVTAETGVTFKRGGRCKFYTAASSGATGTCFYYLYAMYDGTDVKLMLSTRNIAAGDSLEDYGAFNSWAQLPFCVPLYNVSSGAGAYTGILTPFWVSGGWPARTAVQYQIAAGIPSALGFNVGLTTVLNGGTATSFTAVDASKWVPKCSRLAIVRMTPYGRPSAYGLRETGTTDVTMGCGDTNGGNSYQQDFLNVNASGSFDYIGYLVSGPLNVDIRGFVITGIL